MGGTRSVYSDEASLSVRISSFGLDKQDLGPLYHKYMLYTFGVGAYISRVCIAEMRPRGGKVVDEIKLS